MPINGTLGRKLRYALFGGGKDSFIGRVHQIAAELDSRAEIVAGVFSSTRERSLLAAPEYGVPPERVYGDIHELIKAQATLPPEQKIDFLIIATPNFAHFLIALAAIRAKINVFCDKPMTLTLDQAEQLKQAAEEEGVVFVVTHNYTGYPLVRQARQMILAGELGEIQFTRSHYIQGWLRTRLEETDQKQAAWRTDPAKSGEAGCFGDIATHSYNLGRYITGLLPDQISATLKTFEKGRKLDDAGTAVIRYTNGGLGTVTASQISHGRENDLSIEVDGTDGSLSWRQESPNEMWVRRNGKPHQVYTRDPNAPFTNGAGKAACRLPSGHPEAFFEAFANVYTAGLDAIVLRSTGGKFETRDTIYPNVYDGWDGVNFITQSVASSRANGAWLPLASPNARR